MQDQKLSRRLLIEANDGEWMKILMEKRSVYHRFVKEWIEYVDRYKHHSSDTDLSFLSIAGFSLIIRKLLAINYNQGKFFYLLYHMYRYSLCLYVIITISRIHEANGGMRVDVILCTTILIQSLHENGNHII